MFYTYEGGSNGLCHLKNTNAPDYSRPNASCTSGYPGTAPPTPAAPKNISVVFGALRASSSDHFVCWNIDSSRNRGFFWRDLDAVNASSYGAQLARQASAIGRAQAAGFSLLRFGGTGNDYLTYEFGATKCQPLTETQECLNETTWTSLLSFADKASARMIFGLSLNTGKDAAAAVDVAAERGDPFPFPWDPSNAREILEWTIAARLDHLIFGFELGNEQNSRYSGAQIAQSFAVLHNLTIELWPDAAKRPVLFGPDPHSFHAASGDQFNWIAEWLATCAELDVPVWGVTHHEYVEVDPTASGFVSAKVLANSGAIAAMMNKTVRAHSASAHIFAGEAGPHNGGSPVCDHSSMRWAVFGDSFWYADGLAAKARHGYAGFCRQDYIGGDYGLVDCSTGAPLPDYWTALLWARTMGAAVLETTATASGGGGAVIPPETSSARIYAHCAARASGAPHGAVAILAINLGNASTTLHFDSARFGGAIVTVDAIDAYVLSPSDDVAASLTNSSGLLGTGATLNGKRLVLEADGTAPAFVAAKVAGGSVMLPSTSIGFYILPDANHPACGKYY
jgi:heparanase 1